MLLTKVAQVRSTQLTAGLKPVTCMAIYRTRIADMCSFGDEVQSFVKNRRAKARIVCVCVRERERERERERGREREMLQCQSTGQLFIMVPNCVEWRG